MTLPGSVGHDDKERCRAKMPIKCDKCGHDVALNEEFCPKCGQHAGFPNVKEAERVEETDALERRYAKAISDAGARSDSVIVREFETSLQHSYAVINAEPEFVEQLLTSSRNLYATYALQVRSQVRRIAAPENDKERRSVEAAFFGSYAEEIRYAALSLGGPGVISYGSLALHLADDAIGHRATLLEQNTYHFCQTHDIRLLGPIPYGYRAAWGNRGKLAVAKLAHRLTAATPHHQFPALLLRSSGDRAKDEFIEVHIYGRISEASVEAVAGVTSAGRSRKANIVRKIKEILKRKRRLWVEV